MIIKSLFHRIFFQSVIDALYGVSRFFSHLPSESTTDISIFISFFSLYHSNDWNSILVQGFVTFFLKLINFREVDQRVKFKTCSHQVQNIIMTN